MAHSIATKFKHKQDIPLFSILFVVFVMNLFFSVLHLIFTCVPGGGGGGTNDEPGIGGRSVPGICG